jgi:uncharacterized alpha/beta hydrolase family protein
MHQQLWGYKVEEKLNVRVRKQKKLTTTGLLDYTSQRPEKVKFTLEQAMKAQRGVEV